MEAKGRLISPTLVLILAPIH